MKLNDIQTPCYVISDDQFSENVKQINVPFCESWNNNVILGYSVKTNNNSNLILMAKKIGMYAEVVSDDEYDYAQKLGYKNKLIYNGVQKSEEKIIESIKKGIYINLDNFQDIEKVIKNRKKFNKIKVGLRINFNLEKKCPKETTAGNEHSRFGFFEENGDLQKAITKLKKNNIIISGLHMHYSSLTRSINIFSNLAKEAVKIAKKYNLKEIEYIDIGGGFFGGMINPSKPTMKEYSYAITKELEKGFDKKKVKIILEPGSSIIATCVKYYTKVINIRSVASTYFVTTDGSMLHINPFMRQRHTAISYNSSSRKKIKKQIICGSTCIENDKLDTLKNEKMLKIGNMICINNVGAYTMSFNSFFINSPPYIYIENKNNFILISKKNYKIT